VSDGSGTDNASHTVSCSLRGKTVRCK